MEVKNIFANLIMRTYERQRSPEAQQPLGEFDRQASKDVQDVIAISETAGRRLFRDIMENSLQKGLSEDVHE
jgi:hypothetical protein